MITLPNQPIFIIKNQKPQASLMYRSFQGALNMILRSLINDYNRHSTVSNILSEYALTDDPAVCIKLDEESYKMLEQIRAWMKFIKFGFIETTSQIRKYNKYEDPRLMEYLIEAQDRINYENIKEDIVRELNGMKQIHGWTAEFIAEWIQRSVYMKDNDIDLFATKKENKFKESQAKSKMTLKRSSPSQNKHSDQVQTQVGEEPVKKIKQQSINYHVIVVCCQSIIKHSPSDELKLSRQVLLTSFRVSQNIQHMQSMDKAAVKQLYELRSYVKHFMEAFMDVIRREENKKYDDGQMINRLLKAQQYVDPENILDSYRILLRQNQLGMNLPTQAMEEIIAKMISMKKAQNQMLLKKQRGV